MALISSAPGSPCSSASGPAFIRGGVAPPVLAIAVSMAFKGYRPGVLTGLGGVLAVLGNVWMLSPGGGSRVRRVP